VLFAIGEALDSISVGFVAIAFAVLFAVGAWLMRKGRRAGVVLVGILVVLEVAAWPTFDRSSVADWIIQVPFLIIGLVGLGALAVIVYRAVRPSKSDPRLTA
jgi:hypothetical protein